LPERRPRSHRRAIAAAGSAAFLVLAPGVVAGLVPWLLTGWQTESAPLVVRVAGGALTALGAALLLHSFARFALEGLGTPAPIAPTERLVVGGVYRYVRNPMYLAVMATIVGQAALLGQPGLLPYAAVIGVAFFCFVRFYEEPALAARFGESYEEYRRAVPGWWPRLTAWRGD
jgi:protein-S-isoprenylcysteine O-methyltransferase Ste14